MTRARPHRNVTFRRLALDALQFVRCQRPVTALLGRPFRPSTHRIEIDLTYRCNLRCRNCNRSCTQAPSTRDMPLERIDAFIEESLAAGVRWRRIRLLGGEPTLHPELPAILHRLIRYRRRFRPRPRIELCTNGSGAFVQGVLRRLPRGIEVKSTTKTHRQRLFRPFNLAPVDLRRYRLADFSSGCRILTDCGLGLTPLGYYPCAVAGGIDRVFGFGLGANRLPSPDDPMTGLLETFCRLCGHFGFAWPTRRALCSATWRKAYALHGSGFTKPVGPL
jgi:hypothetical protein